MVQDHATTGGGGNLTSASRSESIFRQLDVKHLPDSSPQDAELTDIGRDIQKGHTTHRDLEQNDLIIAQHQVYDRGVGFEGQVDGRLDIPGQIVIPGQVFLGVGRHDPDAESDIHGQFHYRLDGFQRAADHRVIDPLEQMVVTGRQLLDPDRGDGRPTGVVSDPLQKISGFGSVNKQGGSDIFLHDNRSPL